LSLLSSRLVFVAIAGIGAALTGACNGGKQTPCTTDVDCPAHQVCSAGHCVDAPTNPAPTTTALSASPNPATPGQLVTFTAAVTSAGSTPTGSVDFSDAGADGGSLFLGSGLLDAAGKATLSTSTLGAGSHYITAHFSGSANLAGSTSPVLNFFVQSPCPTGACGTFACGHSATANCNCGTPPSGSGCTLGRFDPAQSGGVYARQFNGKSNGFTVSGFGLSGAFTSATPSTLTSTNTIFGAAGQCVRWDYSGTFPTTTNLDLGTVTCTVGTTTVTATKLSDGSYYASRGLLWTAAGQSVTLAASGAGANAAFSVSGSSPAPFTITAPTIASPPTQNSIPTASDYLFTWSGAADGSSAVVTLVPNSNTATAGSEVVCIGQGGSLAIPAALLQGFPASSTGVFSIGQFTPLPVSGSGFTWSNQLNVTPVDPQGNLLNNGYAFKLTP
jgi:hypothetical protein